MKTFRPQQTNQYHFRLIAILVVGVVMVSSSVAHIARAQVMSSGSYSIQADSVNFGGTRSSSGSYALEDTGGEVGTGDLQGTTNILHAGYQQSAAAAAPSTSTSSATQTVSSTSSGGGRLPLNVLNFAATPGTTSIFLSWEYPTGSDIQSVRIVRSATFFPTSLSDGDVIFEGDAQSVIDHNVVKGTRYYYTLFARNTAGFYSSGALAQAQLLSAGEAVVRPPSNPFEQIPDATDVHPVIANLTLLDFDFIQEGKKIAHAGNTVVIDGTKNLTVQLAYDKVPQLLKTIAISLADPQDETRIFTFLLRVNADQTAYEATIAPLTKSGNYRLHAIVLDYKNQGLKRLQGNLRAVVFEGVAGLLERGGMPAIWLWIVAALIVMVGIVMLVRRVRRNRRGPGAAGSGGASPSASGGTVPSASGTSVPIYKKILSLIIIGTMVFVSSGLFATPAHAAINKQINYQGKLADSAGDAVADGTYAMHFNLYTTSSGGSTLWTEDRTGADEVQVTDGLFSVMLGSVTSLASVDFNQTLYLGVAIESDSEMTPRKIIGAVPSAFVADTLDGLDSTQFLRADTGSATIGYFVATSTTASVFPNASTTNITIAGKLFDSVGSGGINGQVLKVSGGVPVWGTDNSGSGGGSEINWTYFNGSGVYVSTTTNQVLIGDIATTSNQKLEVIGGAYISGNLGLGTTSPYAKLSVDGRGVFNQDVRANYFTATSTSAASTFPYASTTALTVSGTASTTNLVVSGLSSGGVAVTASGALYSYSTSTWRFASSTLLADSNTWSGSNLFNENISVAFGKNLILGPSTGLSIQPTIGGTVDFNNLGGGTPLSVSLSTNQVSIPNLKISTLSGLLLGTSGVVSAVSTSSLNIALSDTTGTLAVSRGGTGATTFGQGWIYSNGGTGALAASTSPTVNYVTATSTTQASTFPYASTTALTVSGTNGLQLATGLNGPLHANAGLISATTSIGVLYGGTGLTSIASSSLLIGGPNNTFIGFATSSLGVALSDTTGTLAVNRGGTGLSSYTLGDVLYANGTGSLAGTSTANLKTTLALNNVENTALSTWAGSTNLTTLGTIGTGLWHGTAIEDAYLTKSGNWTGTFDGQEGSYYLDARNLTNFGTPFYTFFSATTTDALTEGASRLYWTNDRFDARLAATTTLPNLTTLLGLTDIIATRATTTNATTTALYISGTVRGAGLTSCSSATDKLTWNSTTGQFGCGTDASGSGSGGGSWSTTTSTVAGEFVNYSNNTTDIVVIGGTSTSTARYWFDPNISTSYLAGNVGIGSTSPSWRLSVAGIGSFDDYVRASYFTATSTTVASTFPYASTTALTVSGTNGLQLATGLNGPLQANAGLVSATTSIGVLYGGTGLTSSPAYGNILVGNASGGYTLTATSSLGLPTFSYLFPSNATSTLLSFTGGLTSYASTTIGDGTQTGGLTISGGATTTGNAYFSGNVGIGTTSSMSIVDISNAPTSLATYLLNVHATKYGGGQGVNGMGINLLAATGADSGSQNSGESVGGAVTISSGNGGLGTTPSFAGGAGGLIQIAAGAGGNGSGSNGNGGTVYITGGLAGAGAGTSASNGNVVLGVNSSGTIIGNVGIGTTSPYAKLSVDGRGVFNQDVRANYFTATSTSVASTFPYASTTALTVSGTASTTNLVVSGLSSGGVAVTAGGALYSYSTSTWRFASSTLLSDSNTWSGSNLFNENISVAFGKNLILGPSTGLSIQPTIGGTVDFNNLGGGTPLSVSLATNQVSISSLKVGTLSGLLLGTSGAVSAVSTSSLNIALSDTTGTLTVSRGGTGATTFGQGWIYSNGGTGALAASTSPTVNYLIATSTSIASTFPYASTTALTVSGTASTTNLIVSGLGGASTRCLQVGTDGTVSANASACGTGGGGTFSWTPTTNYGVTVNATSTPIWFQNGLMASTTAYLTYASSTALTVSGNAYFPGSGVWNSSGFVGIGTSSPYAALSVVGASGVVADKFYATSTTATSTFAGSLNVGNGAIVYDNTTGTTSINYLEAGSMSFAADSGVISWIDLPVTSASANGVANSYSANLNGNALLTIYGVSNGSGAVTNTAVGIGTTSPRWKLAVAGIGSFDDYVRASYFTATSTTASTFPYASTTALTVSGTNGLQLATGLNGPLQANAGLISATTSIGVLYGGTGLTSSPAYGNILVGNASGGYTLTATSSLGLPTFSYLFPSNATSTLLSFTGGLISSASTTIGAGTQAGGLTISGGATTTGDSYIVGNLGVGTISPSTKLQVAGSATFDGNVMLDESITIGNLVKIARFNGDDATYNDIGFYGPPSTLLMTILNTGNVGIGTSSPYAKLSVDGRGVFNQDVRANYFTATSTSVASTFPYASTTALTVSGTASTTNLVVSGAATTTNLAVTSVISSLLKTNSLGQLTAAVAGTDYSNFGYLFPSNATSTLLSFTGGLISSASTTIGAGTQAGGLTISGGATTTGNQYVAGTLTSAGQILAPNGTVGAPGFAFTSAPDNGFRYNPAFVIETVTNGATALSVGPSEVLLPAVSSLGWGSSGVSSADTFLSRDAANTLALKNSTNAQTLNVYGTFTNTSNYERLSINPNSTSIDFTSGAAGSGTARPFNFTGANLGIGTTSPYAKLSVDGRGVFNQDVRANYFTATSTSVASTFPYASTTALTVSGTASTTNLVVSSLGGASTRCLQVGTDGTVSANASACGTGGGGGGVGWATTTASNESIYYYGTGNVAIGTSTPYSKLSVWGSGTGTNRLFELTNNASTTLASVLENGTAYFLGNLGIGTTSPNWKLSVAGIGSFDDYVRASYFTATSTTATSTFAGGIDAGAGNLLYDFTTGVTSASSFQTGNLNFDTDAGMVSWTDLTLSSASSGTIEGYTASLNGSSTISVYGISAGSGWLQPDYPRVAIGSSTPPSSKLTIFANGTGGGGTFEVVNSASTTQFKIFDNGVTGVGTTSPFATFAVNPVAGVASNQFVVGSSTATNFIVTNGGSVGIGTTTPWRTLSVTGTVAVNGLSTGAGGEYAVCIDNVTKELSSAGAQSCLVSSRRFKDDIAPLENGLDEVMKLKPSTFTLKNQAKTGSTTDTHLGFIAEEVDGVDKRLVQYEADGITPRTVRYEEVTALLAKAIQEQQLQIGGLASTTVDLAAKTSATSLSTVAAQTNVSLLTSNVDAHVAELSLKLASSSQSTRSLASALDATNAAVSAIADTLAGAEATTSHIIAQISGIDERVSDVQEHISTLSASTTLIDALASSTADRLASSTAEAVLHSSSFLEKIFSAFMDFLASAVARIKSVFVGELHVEDKLCVDDVCINKDQLKALLVNAGGVSSTTPAAAVQSNTAAVMNTQVNVPAVTPAVVPATIQESPAELVPTPAVSATTTSATSTSVTTTVTVPVASVPEPAPAGQQSPEPAQPDAPITETVESVAPAALPVPSEPAAAPEPAVVAPSAPSEPAPAPVPVSDPAPAVTQ